MRFARGRNLTRSAGRIGVLSGKRYRRIILRDNKSRVLRPKSGAHRTAAKLAIGDSIERIYNRHRRFPLSTCSAQPKNKTTQTTEAA